jgi:hypothetical protein
MKHLGEFFFTGPASLMSYEEEDLYAARLVGGIFSDRYDKNKAMIDWCTELFGAPGRVMLRERGLARFPQETLPRWYHDTGDYYFTNELDRTVFLLTWSSND